jgi:hypothetical protein
MKAAASVSHAQLTPKGPLLPPPEVAAELAERFQREHVVRLPGFLSPELLQRLQQQMEAAAFRDKLHKGIGQELRMEPSVGEHMIMFMLNMAPVLSFVSAINGQVVRGFHGRIYRMEPRPEHYDSWHDDLMEGRTCAISINVGEPYEGGALEMRLRSSEQLLWTLHNTGPGDAILFALRADLQHRITSVTGTRKKTAFAGWFSDRDDVFFPLKRRPTA